SEAASAIAQFKFVVARFVDRLLALLKTSEPVRDPSQRSVVLQCRHYVVDGFQRGLQRGIRVQDAAESKLRELVLRKLRRQATEVATFLRKDLVLDLDAGRARTLKKPHGTSDVERTPEARIGIHKDGNADGIGDRCNVLSQFGQCDKPDIRNAQAHIRDAGSG